METEAESNLVDILYVDDEANNLFSFKASFRDRYKVITAISAKEAKQLLEEYEVPMVISDQRMPEEQGVEFLKYVKKKYPRTIRVLLTGFSDLDAVISAVNDAEIYRYLTKPWNETDIDLTVKNAMEIYNLRKENIRLMETLKQVNEQLEFMLRQQLIS